MKTKGSNLKCRLISAIPNRAFPMNRRYAGLFTATLIVLSFLTEGTLFAQYTISTLAASSQAGPKFDGRGVAVDSAGNVYATGRSAGPAVLKVTNSGIATVAGGNVNGYFPGCGYPATAIGMTDLSGVSVDSSGTLYVFEGAGNGLLLRVSGGTVSCLLGGEYFFGNGRVAGKAGNVSCSAAVPNYPG